MTTAAAMGTETRRGWLVRLTYKPDEAMRYIAGLAAWYRSTARPQGKPFEEGGAIERREMRTEGSFVNAAVGFADVLRELDRLPHFERLVCLGVWRDGGKVTDVARRLEKRDSAVWAAFYAGTEALLYALTREPGMKDYFRCWREARHRRRLQDGI